MSFQPLSIALPSAEQRVKASDSASQPSVPTPGLEVGISVSGFHSPISLPDNPVLLLAESWCLCLQGFDFE